MECIVCKKNVNDMTFFCDECGAQLLEEEVKVNLNNIDELIQQPEFDQRFSDEFEEEIRRAYYLSLMSTRVTGETLVNLKKYFDYFYLRLMYEEYKSSFLDSEKTIEKGLIIVTALYKKTITSKVQEVLKEEYAEVYETKKMPKHIINRVPEIYITKERNVSKIVKGRELSQIFVSIILSFIATYLITTFISGLMIGYQLAQEFGARNINQSQVMSFIEANSMYILIPLVISVIWALFKGYSDKKVDIVKHMFHKNKALNKQIRKEVKPLLKKIKRKK